MDVNPFMMWDESIPIETPAAGAKLPIFDKKIIRKDVYFSSWNS